MTRKDYEATAAAFRHTLSDAQTSESASGVWAELRDCMADMFALDNPRFDRDRFYKATEQDGR